MLKKFLLAALLIFAENSVASAEHTFKVTNNTGKTITQIYITATAEGKWIMQTFGDLYDGETTEITFDPSPWLPRRILRYFDIGVNYDDFTQQSWRGLDLYNYSEIILTQENFSVKYK